MEILEDNLKFVDRESDFIKRKKLTIIEQTPTSIIVDMDRADNPTVDGTKINADAFNKWNGIVKNSQTSSATALTTANTAITNSSEALANSNNALSKSTEALNKANTAIETVQTNLGTVVKVNSEAQPLIYFNSDPQTQLSGISNNLDAIGTNLTSVASEVTSLESITSNQTSQINNLNNTVVNLATEQTITGLKHFTNNIDAKKITCTEINLLV